MADITTFIAHLEDELANFVNNKISSQQNIINLNIKDFLASIKEDLQGWTTDLANGDLSEKDFKWLVLSIDDSYKLEILKNSGLEQALGIELVTGILNTIITTAISEFLA